MVKPIHRPRSSRVATFLGLRCVLPAALPLLLALLYVDSLGTAAAEMSKLKAATPAASLTDDGGAGREQSGGSQDEITLLPGRSFEGAIVGGGRHLYRVSAGASQYLRVVVEQHGIILSAALADPDGTELIQTDNPSGAYGPIYISAITELGGNHRLEVRSKEAWANAGRYVVRVEESRPAAPADGGRVAAEKSFAEGRRLINDPKATPDTRRQALRKFEDSLAYWRQDDDRHWVALTQFCVAVAHRSLGDRRAAEKHFLEGLAVQLNEYDWRLRASLLNDTGSNYYMMGAPEQALKFLHEAFEVYRSHQDRRGQASALNNIGTVHLRAGRYREASESFRKALPLRHAENDRSGEAIVLNNIGGVSDRLGEPHAALEGYSGALRIQLELERHGELSNPLVLPVGFNNVALAHERLGEWQLSLDNYEEALKRFEGQAPVESAKTLDNIGELYAALGQPDLAKEYYKKAKAFAEGKDPAAEANILSHIGQVFVEERNFTEALAYFERALALRKSASDQANSHTDIGTVHVRQGDARRALTSYGLALRLSESGDDRRAQALARHKIGEAQFLLGDYEKALEDFARALPLWSAVADQRGLAATLHGIALAERGRNNLAEALRRSRESINIIESLRTRVASHRLRTSYFASQQNHYELYVDLRMRLYRIDKSTEHLAAALEASERARARSLVDTLAEARAEVLRGADETLIRREREAQQRLNEKARIQMELLSRKHSEAEAASAEREVSKALEEYDAIKATIRASSPSYARLTQPPPLSVSEIQQLLDEDTLLIEYLLGEERSYVWLVTDTSIIATETLPTRSDIESLARGYYEALSAPPGSLTGGADSAESRAAILSRVLLGPMAERLGKKRLLVVGDGMLHYLPFAALPVPDSPPPDARRAPSAGRARTARPRYLVEDHEIIGLPSASALAELRRDSGGRRPAPLTVAVIADPVFTADDPRLKTAPKPKPAPPDDAERAAPPAVRAPLLRSGLPPLTPLPGTRREAMAIRNAVAPDRVTAYLGFEANRATLAKLQDGSHRVVHFATHGVLNTEHPELSGVALSMLDAEGRQRADGMLWLHDIYNLKLPVDLVVLSACSTGLGRLIKGEGLVGLTRGFMYAGAPQVVASLWPVEDLGTADLMTRFYHHMDNSGMPPAAALRQAQIEMLTRGPRRSPYYWGGFVIQGEWKEKRRSGAV